MASIKITTRCLIERQLHTMVRPSDAAGARWDEIDFENQLWIIPTQRLRRSCHYPLIAFMPSKNNQAQIKTASWLRPPCEILGGYKLTSFAL